MIHFQSRLRRPRRQTAKGTAAWSTAMFRTWVTILLLGSSATFAAGQGIVDRPEKLTYPPQKFTPPEAASYRIATGRRHAGLRGAGSHRSHDHGQRHHARRPGSRSAGQGGTGGHDGLPADPQRHRHHDGRAARGSGRVPGGPTRVRDGRGKRNVRSGRSSHLRHRVARHTEPAIEGHR